MKEVLGHNSEESKHKVITASAAALVGTTALLAIREITRRRSLSAREALEAIADPTDLQYSGRVHILAAMFNKSQPCMVHRDIQAASGIADPAKFEQTLQSLSEYELDKHALIRGVAYKQCKTIQPAHYELTEFGGQAWEKMLFKQEMVVEIMAARQALSGNS